MDTLNVWIDALSNSYPKEDMRLMSEFINMNEIGFSLYFVEAVLNQVRKELREKAGLKTCGCDCHN